MVIGHPSVWVVSGLWRLGRFRKVWRDCRFIDTRCGVLCSILGLVLAAGAGIMYYRNKHMSATAPRDHVGQYDPRHHKDGFTWMRPTERSSAPFIPTPTHTPNNPPK